MTVDDMREYAKQALREMKDQLKRTASAAPLFRAYYTDGRKQDFNFPPGTEALMNSGEAKEFIFGILREHTKLGGVQLWIFCHDANRGQFTEEGMKHSHELDEHGYNLQKLAAKGWVVVEEVLVVEVQTEDEVLYLQQVYVRGKRNHIEWMGPPQENRTPQSLFSGRTKMFGATEESVADFVKRNF